MDEPISGQQARRSSSQEEGAAEGVVRGTPLRLEGAASLLLDAVPAVLYEHVIARREGLLAESGALVVDTGHFTGRSPSDKFIVRDRSTRDEVDWGEVNQPMEADAFERLLRDMEAHLEGMRLLRAGLYAGSDPRYRVRVRVVTEYAWHSLFAQNMFVRPPGAVRRALTGSCSTCRASSADPRATGAGRTPPSASTSSGRTALIAGTPSTPARSRSRSSRS